MPPRGAGFGKWQDWIAPAAGFHRIGGRIIVHRKCTATSTWGFSKRPKLKWARLVRSDPGLLAFGDHNITVLSRLEYLVQVGSLRLGRHERGIFFPRYIEVAIHIAAGAKLDFELPFRWKISDRSYARRTNWNSPHRQARLKPASYLMHKSAPLPIMKTTGSRSSTWPRATWLRARS